MGLHAALCVLAIALLSSAAFAQTDWRARANERIERVRKGDFVVTLVDAAGAPVAAARVDVKQVRSHFHFGVCVTGNPESDDPAERRYWRFVLDHFNTVVSEDDMKWYSVEQQQGQLTYDKADRMVAWARRNGLAVRGHTLFWAKEKFTQPWVQALGDDALRAAIDDHVRRTVGRYKGQLIAWDVNNEMLDGHFYEKRLGPAVHARMFSLAHEVDPGVPLFVNDYSILGNDARTTAYLKQVADLRAAGAPVGGIGVQEHACERIVTAGPTSRALATEAERQLNFDVTPDQLYATLDRLADAGLPVQLTEISSKSKDEQRRADGLEALYRVAFSHPKVDLILLWGFWEKRHWLGRDAALVDAEFRPTAAGRVLEKLLLEEWRTSGTFAADDTGVLRFRGFYGTYALTATGPDGRVRGATVELIPGKTEARAILK
jgi:GH35 family endo-1,4-beta-xylanase